MPTVPASNLPYTGVPTAEPQVGVPSRFQTERATPEDFGAGVGTSVSNLGQHIGRGADVLAENAIRIQEQFNQVAASDATNKYQDNETKLMYGDPDVPGDVGFYGKKGEDAMRALPQVRDQILKLREGLRTGLQNPRQQIMFDSETRRLQAVTLSRMGEHYDREFNTYRGHVADAKIKNADSALGQAIAADDEPAATLAVKQRMEAEIEKLRVQGLANNPDAVNAALQNARGDFVKVRAEALALKNPLAAVEYVKRNTDALKGDEANQLLGRYRARGDVLQAQVDWGGIPAPSGPAYEARKGRGDSSDPVEHFLDLVEARESRGRNIMQNVVGPQGGYNPSTGTITGPSTAQGYFQITNTTWRGFAERAGVSLSEYPNAMSAPYEVQRQVARTIATTSGVQHWTQFNAEVLRDASAAGLPTFGPIAGGKTAADVGPARQAADSGNVVAFGDSIAAHLILNSGVGGAVYNFDKRNDSTAVSGWGPVAIGNMIDNTPESKIRGKDIVLSTGASNVSVEGKLNDGNLEVVSNQIKALYAKGAKSVNVLGVGNAPFLDGRNDQLAQVAQANGASFAGAIDPENVQPDGVHAKNPNALLVQVQRSRGPQDVPKPPVRLVSNEPDQIVKPIPKLDFPLPPLEGGELPDAQVPGMADALKRIQETVPADDVVRRINAVKAARQALNAQYQDSQRALKLHTEQMKAQATLVQDDYLKRMYPGAPNPPSIQEVLTDNKLREHPEVKRTLVSFMERENKTDPAALVSKQNTMQLFAKMNLPDGEAEKITTEEPFNKAYTGQEVTRADRDWLVTQFRTQRSAGGETIKNLKAQIITAAKPTILGPLAAADERLIEPDNAFKMFNFIHAVDEKIDEYQKAGKNPVDLFNPKKPDFVGSDDFMRPFASPMAQRMRQQVNERNTVGPPVPALGQTPPALDITKIPDADLIQGLNSRKYDYNAGVKELERRGYGHRPAPPVR